MPGFSDTFGGAVCAADIDAITGYLEAGADIKSVNDSGYTVLHNIAWISEPNPNGRYGEAVRLLVQAGADVHAREKNGRTPLHVAVGCSQAVGSEVVDALLDAGADPNAEDNNGSTPVHSIVSWWSGGKDDCIVKIARALLDAGVDLARQACGHTPLHGASGGEPEQNNRGVNGDS